MEFKARDTQHIVVFQEWGGDKHLTSDICFGKPVTLEKTKAINKVRQSTFFYSQVQQSTFASIFSMMTQKKKTKMLS